MGVTIRFHGRLLGLVLALLVSQGTAVSQEDWTRDPVARDFLKRILETPSPSGYEAPVQEIVRAYAASFADRVKTDVHGNVIAVKNAEAPLRVMLAAHCDQIGLVVEYVDGDGFLYVQSIGGWDTQILLGQRVSVWTDHGPVLGLIARKPTHLLSDSERSQAPAIKDLWIDIAAAGREEAKKLCRIGDAVTVELRYCPLRNRRAISAGMDDKCGVWVIMEAMRRAEKNKLKCAVYAVSTVQEEIGLRGAATSTFGIEPQIGIAVDVCHATDCPTIDKKENGEVRLGEGPVIYRGPNMNPKLVQRLVETAGGNKLPHQLAASGRATPTDANVIQVSRAGVATALVSIPNRYMHSPVEMISLDDLDRAADLLARFLETYVND
ncbi:MAG: M42 family metallopeptidase [Bryobacteraceae bacterium]|nr:M42 family metallopeptidase [Bryobacteraceae bacterium]